MGGTVKSENMIGKTPGSSRILSQSKGISDQTSQSAIRQSI
jgi:hypothetical protein